ncbi:MAG: glycosyltransferase family 4 protein [Lacipirellulaceae bacterium]
MAIEGFQDISEYRLATYALAGIAGWLAAYLMTPVVRQLAVRFDFVDRPGGRKTHAKPVALGGGVAVLASATLAAAVAYLFADWAVPRVFFEGDARQMAGLAFAAAATMFLGLYDDAVNMRGRYKLVAQVLIAAVLTYMSVRIESFEVFGNRLELGWFAWPFTIFWLVGATNAINLLDGIDGLASSLGLVLCLTLAAINGLFGQFPETIVMLAMGGALLGFLRYNFAPASIYLGDAGSMVVGLMIGAVAVQTQYKTPAFAAMTIPLAVWAIPILDSGAAIVRRRLTGRSIFAPDRGHLHHSLLTRGWSVRQASLFIALVCATTCLSAVLAVFYRNEWLVIGTVVAVVAFLISTKTFGHIELALVRDKMRQHGLRLRTDESGPEASTHGMVRLQGKHEWERMWATLVESAEDYGLTRLTLTIHLPAQHEAFYANWQAPKTKASSGVEKQRRADSTWRLSNPLTVDGEPVGKLEIAGVADDPTRSTLEQLAQVLDFLEPIEEDIRRVRDTFRPSPAAARTAEAVSDPHAEVLTPAAG